MALIRKMLGALFAVLGTYYCALAGFTLLRLPSVTRQWIEQSGDPDFHYDYSLFMMLTALGAALVALLLLWLLVRRPDHHRPVHTAVPQTTQ